MLYCFWMFVNKLFIYLKNAHISKSKRCFNVKFSTYYFHIKTNTMVDFQICISVPLRTPFLTERFQWLLLTVTGFQPAALLKKGPQQRRFSVRFAKFFRTSFYRTPPDDCFLCLPVILRSFLEHLWETAHFMYKLQNFNHQIK